MKYVAVKITDMNIGNYGYQSHLSSFGSDLFMLAPNSESPSLIFVCLETKLGKQNLFQPVKVSINK
jgi:hypothetical protein